MWTTEFEKYYEHWHSWYVSDRKKPVNKTAEHKSSGMATRWLHLRVIWLKLMGQLCAACGACGNACPFNAINVGEQALAIFSSFSK